MATITKSDTGLTRLIRRLLQRQKASSKQVTWFGVAPRAKSRDDERRVSDRRCYHHWQLMASFDRKNAPCQSDFRLVLCHDLSPSGFSFFCDKPPRQKRLVIALGTAPFTFFEAEIVHSEPALGDGVSGWLLGCRFLRTLEAADTLD